mgnify:CR=1 FL=1|jgi:hypothetical protein|tara:strand:+ start:805 stop:1023 length:219 start_codon:yes stop_codon:yes gene_type:complete
MLMINFIRALLLFFAVGLYHIYQKDFLSVWEGGVIFSIAFFGLTLKEIIEDYVERAFNPEDPKGLVYRGPRA